MDEDTKNLRSAQIVCILANINRDEKKHPRPYKVEEFIPRKRKRRKQTPEDMLEVIKALNAFHGGKVIE